MGIPLSQEPRYAVFFLQIGNPFSPVPTWLSECAFFQACSARKAGRTENVIYSCHFGGKCHFIWLNHANNGAHFLRKSLIFIKWRMPRLSPVDTFVEAGKVICPFGQS